MRFSKHDPNSYAQPENVVTRHADLFWNVDFKSETISGEAVLHFEVVAKEIEEITLDVSDLTIEDAWFVVAEGRFPVTFFVSDEVKDIGAKLTIQLPKTSGEIKVAIKYKTSPKASGLQWLTPENTAGKIQPYVYSQCQAIHARSIVPCQDSPMVKFTYRVEVTHPPELTALISGIRLGSENGKTLYEQTVPTPAYLLAIAVGAIVSRELSSNIRVWAEKEVVDEAAEEFSETPQMLKIAEEICGPYVWKQYDLLVMPPSFPFGGMENPCLTFVTPTLLAGDKSLATVVAHEISHSWTGNLVTNANWEHFWLNEGFTMFVEGKIQGRMFGDKERDFLALQGNSELVDCLKGQLLDTPELQKLIVDLTDCNPDDTYSAVPYMKGQNFLRYIEDTLGGPTVFEPFFRYYLNKYKYKSIVTDDFKATVYEYFKGKADEQLAKIDWDLWLYGQGMPPIIPKYDTSIVEAVKQQAEVWSKNTAKQIREDPSLVRKDLQILQKIEVLEALVQIDNAVDTSNEWLDLLIEQYKLAGTKNSAVLFRLARLFIKGQHINRLDEVFAFANSNFRMKYVRPIYRDLNKWPEAKPLAVDNFNKYKSQMMKCCAQAVAKDLELEWND